MRIVLTSDAHVYTVSDYLAQLGVGSVSVTDDLVVGEVTENRAHGASTNLLYVRVDVVHGETCLVRVANAEEERAAARDRNIVAGEADCNLLVSQDEKR